jgi:hypothetical protein
MKHNIQQQQNRYRVSWREDERKKNANLII